MLTGSQGESVSIRDTVRPGFYESVAEILRTARKNAYRAVNLTMIEAYWNVGRRIVEEEQQGKERAEYGKYLIRDLANRLREEFGKGFTESNLRYFRMLYLAYPGDARRSIRHALRDELSWTHYRLLLGVEKPEARTWYMKEAADQNWSTRALERQIHSLYYERLLMSRDKAPVVDEMREKTAPLAPQPEDFIKDPYVLEFLGIPDTHKFRESELEEAIIGKLQAFLLELGKGFSFIARQKRISTETKDFFVDLVFYNYLLKCFVLVDLKTGELTHQDIGQMDMYVRLYEDKVKGPDDNPTIGIILCTEKDRTIVKYYVLKENRRLFAAKYKLYLPTEEELQKELESEREWFIRERAVPYSTEVHE
jgi:predicted nuclease of restriction endonuclease-like (RecB) superfamily